MKTRDAFFHPVPGGAEAPLRRPEGPFSPDGSFQPAGPARPEGLPCPERSFTGCQMPLGRRLCRCEIYGTVCIQTTVPV